MGEGKLLDEFGNLVEIQPARDPRALSVGLELDELPFFGAVHISRAGNGAAHIAKLEIEIVFFPVCVESGLIQPVRERREQGHPVQTGIRNEGIERWGGSDEVLSLDLDLP